MQGSELRKCWHFHTLKLLFPSIFYWNFRYFVSETIMFKSQITSAYIYNQCSFLLLLYGMALKTTVCRQNTNIDKIYIYASERSERAQTIFAFSHSKTAISSNILLVLQILCRYKLHACRLTCTDKFPNVPTKLRKSIIGAIAPIATLVPVISGI